MIEWSAKNRGRLFKNQTGGAYRNKKDFIRYGLKKGSSDLIGYEMIDNIPVFTGIEVKTKDYPKISPDQITWMNILLRSNANCYIALQIDESYQVFKIEKVFEDDSKPINAYKLLGV
jgi:hypothetical protein